jgi:hypothetical protein
LHVLHAGLSQVEGNGRRIDPDAFHCGYGGESAAPKVLYGANEPGPLGWRDAFKRPLEASVPTGPHLDDNDKAPAPRHEVELQRTQTHVASDHCEAAREEIVGDGELGATSACETPSGAWQWMQRSAGDALLQLLLAAVVGQR